MKPSVLITIGLTWLGGIVLLCVVFMGVGEFGIYVGARTTGNIMLVWVIGIFLLVGWLIPLSVGLLRLFRKAQ